MLANFLIGLREGLEASLIVGILIAYLVKTDRRHEIRYVWLGVAIALAVSIAFGIGLNLTQQALTFEAKEAFGGTMSLIAVGFVTWMIFWMRATARSIKGELEGRIDSALAMGPLTLAVVAFVAVGREGVETSMFTWVTGEAVADNASPYIGTVIGLTIAVILGISIYLGAVRINLGKFFTWTGAFLVVVAAGVLAYAIHDLQEAGILPGLNNTVFNISSTLSLDSWLGTVLKGTFNYNPAPTWLEFVAWLAYLIPVMTIFLWPSRPQVLRRPVEQREPVAS
ncbi:MAG TPA: iron uptake transporter permease EfeU [Nocardioidaceae bacterium]|nr:iron uptake transporter permease EfeU [Nocardioidaceae bacterium]